MKYIFLIISINILYTPSNKKTSEVYNNESLQNTKLTINTIRTEAGVPLRIFTVNDECCNTGGEGATECTDSGSIGFLGFVFTWENSVACEEGYYACCNGDDAQCTLNGSDAWCTEPAINE